MMFERFSDSARAIVRGAHDEARELHHPRIGTEHLLLAMLRPEHGLAAKVLAEAGVTRAEVLAGIDQWVGERRRFGPDDADALRSIGIDLDAVVQAIEQSFGPYALDASPDAARSHRLRPRHVLRHRRGSRTAPARRPTGRHIPFAARSKKALELSLRESLRLKHKYIGSEHLLLGLIREGEGLAARILVDSGHSLEDLRGRVLAALAKAA
jgi:ATP-dependent Clp protease ATP-binding subunit ClpA